MIILFTGSAMEEDTMGSVDYVVSTKNTDTFNPNYVFSINQITLENIDSYVQ